MGFLLDLEIRRTTNGGKSLDDVMRLAWQRYSGPRGFTPDEFRALASEVAGQDLSAWLQQALASTDRARLLERLRGSACSIRNDSPSTPRAWLGLTTDWRAADAEERWRPAGRCAGAAGLAGLRRRRQRGRRDPRDRSTIACGLRGGKRAWMRIGRATGSGFSSRAASASPRSTWSFAPEPARVTRIEPDQAADAASRERLATWLKP